MKRLSIFCTLVVTFALAFGAALIHGKGFASGHVLADDGAGAATPAVTFAISHDTGSALDIDFFDFDMDDTIEFVVTVMSDVDLGMAQFKVDYDTDLLGYVGFAPNLAMENFRATTVETYKDVYPDAIVMGFYNELGQSVNAGEIELGTLSFKFRADFDFANEPTSMITIDTQVDEGNRDRIATKVRLPGEETAELFHEDAQFSAQNVMINWVNTPALAGAAELQSITLKNPNISFAKDSDENAWVAGSALNFWYSQLAPSDFEIECSDGASFEFLGLSNGILSLDTPTMAQSVTTLRLKVSSANGKNTPVYEILVARQPAKLGTFSVGLQSTTVDGEWDERAFVTDQVNYFNRKYICINVDNAVIKFGDETFESGEILTGLDAGTNVVWLTVSPKTGAPVTFTVKINIKQPNANANLLSLSITDDGGEAVALEPEFNAEVTAYFARVRAEVESVTIAATAAPGFGIVGLGEFELPSNESTFTVTVTSETGTTKDYQITVIRDAYEPSPEPEPDPDPEPEPDKFDILPWVIAAAVVLFVAVMLLLVVRKRVKAQRSADDKTQDDATQGLE